VQYDQSVASLTILARILWLRGFPERAWRTASQALELALQINHGTSICYTLALAGVVIAHCNGDTLTARDRLDLLLQQAQKHSVQLFHTWAQCYEGTAQIADMQGLGLVADILVTFNARAVDEALFERARSGAAGWCSPEILRVRAEAMPDIHRAEALLLEALGLAHQQGALAWELRCADLGAAVATAGSCAGRPRPAGFGLRAIYRRLRHPGPSPRTPPARRVAGQTAGLRTSPGNAHSPAANAPPAAGCAGVPGHSCACC